MVDEQLQKDIASILIRVLQVHNSSKRTEYFVWERIITCDVPRLERYLTGSIRGHYQNVVNEFGLSHDMETEKFETITIETSEMQ